MPRVKQFRIDKFNFDQNAPFSIMGLSHGENYVGLNWPVAYIINNKKEAYVGETIHASNRVSQHLANEERRKLTEIRIISDDSFNKSVILDLEAFLIKHMQADGKFILQNGNNGLHDHDYYQRQRYSDEFIDIWEELRKIGIAQHSIDEIENSELFKYSPYKTLGDEQTKVEAQILEALIECNRNKNKTVILVKGGAGTGKTVLGIYLIKAIADFATGNKELDYVDEGDEGFYLESGRYAPLTQYEKIGIVIPQKSLRTSLKDVFKGIRNLHQEMVLSPQQVVTDYLKTKKEYDLLIVDEAHRLKCKDAGNLSIGQNKSFKENNRQLGFDEEKGTELDWLLKCSKNLILFRDPFQKVRKSDIDDERFNRLIHETYNNNVFETELIEQWRCRGGSDYITYILNILHCEQPCKKAIKNYDLKLYLNCQQMVKDIKKKEKQYSLCRVVAGYAWPWNKKDLKQYTIDIQGNKYRWNMTADNWIATNAINEIGCIHTVQGYDLNYAGVIIGEDIKYDPKTEKIYAVKKNYYDSLGKAGLADDPEALLSYLTNIYMTLLTRGIKGTYVYVCDDELRKYFANFFDVV